MNARFGGVLCNGRRRSATGRFGPFPGQTRGAAHFSPHAETRASNAEGGDALSCEPSERRIAIEESERSERDDQAKANNFSNLVRRRAITAWKWQRALRNLLNTCARKLPADRAIRLLRVCLEGAAVGTKHRHYSQKKQELCLVLLRLHWAIQGSEGLLIELAWEGAVAG